jgi:hypothetical protein
MRLIPAPPWAFTGRDISITGSFWAWDHGRAGVIATAGAPIASAAKAVEAITVAAGWQPIADTAAGDRQSEQAVVGELEPTQAGPMLWQRVPVHPMEQLNVPVHPMEQLSVLALRIARPGPRHRMLAAVDRAAAAGLTVAVVVAEPMVVAADTDNRYPLKLKQPTYGTSGGGNQLRRFAVCAALFPWFGGCLVRGGFCCQERVGAADLPGPSSLGLGQRANYTS